METRQKTLATRKRNANFYIIIISIIFEVILLGWFYLQSFGKKEIEFINKVVDALPIVLFPIRYLQKKKKNLVKGDFITNFCVNFILFLVRMQSRD